MSVTESKSYTDAYAAAYADAYADAAADAAAYATVWDRIYALSDDELIAQSNYYDWLHGPFVQEAHGWIQLPGADVGVVPVDRIPWTLQ